MLQRRCTGWATSAPRCAAPASDKVAFTGSTATARKVMAACAETLTPVLLEGGGKDAMIVDADADLDAAAEAVRLGRADQRRPDLHRHRAGLRGRRRSTTPSSTRWSTRAGRLTVGAGRTPTSARSPCPSQIDVIRRHIDDALARGGRAVLGGADAVQPPYVQPTVLVDVPEDSAAVREETFGPTLTISRVARRRRGRRPRQRPAVRPGRLGLRPAARGGDRPAAALRHGVGQLGADLRRHAHPAVRRRRRLRLRPHPRRGRAARVRPAPRRSPGAGPGRCCRRRPSSGRRPTSPDSSRPSRSCTAGECRITDHQEDRRSTCVYAWWRAVHCVKWAPIDCASALSTVTSRGVPGGGVAGRTGWRGRSLTSAKMHVVDLGGRLGTWTPRRRPAGARTRGQPGADRPRTSRSGPRSTRPTPATCRPASPRPLRPGLLQLGAGARRRARAAAALRRRRAHAGRPALGADALPLLPHRAALDRAGHAVPPGAAAHRVRPPLAARAQADPQPRRRHPPGALDRTAGPLADAALLPRLDRSSSSGWPACPSR